MEYRIPVDIVRNILSRLPGKSQDRFMIVCKEWHSIMNDDPSFSIDMLFIYGHGQDTLYSDQPCAIPLCSLSKTTTNYKIRAKNINIINCDPIQAILTGGPSCIRLLLVYRSRSFEPILWNPFSGKSLQLSPDLGNLFKETFGIGYDVQTNDYKVVRLDRNGETFIYSLKARVWREIEGIPNVRIETYCAVFANDALHWLAEKGQRQVVIRLDLRTETYNQLPQPSCCHTRRYGDHCMHVLEGRLFFLCSNSLKVFKWDIWILKDCKNWSKLFTLGKRNISEYGILNLVAYVKSKDQVVIRYGEVFMWFDLKSNKCLKTVTIKGIGSACCQVLPASQGWFSGNNFKLDIQASSSTPLNLILPRDDIN